ncbi:uncharacterized protein SPAPADRAFT_59613 [Spathaspora passalidarum NRRL Y-27907]|uniref:Peroxisomal membrane protein PEX14 n=1 Tax=Spathaspora passalidarum (strain NRRL Y-27907 / 11-Y1) TaxID=619300 RepID=G3AHL6_SPAPN|nr:uncharacterized protein SPAPADRAFT_59613 [Spathaspora passalidarum NRRL Y-27907]EGW34180.1 hypothetical protein SPAPADRAFT_59613 [Spathaspora passalidarum NRRL Y-27907]
MNDELINSAVAFLKDPQVVNSPLTKKVEFLETKGLNQQEIEEALRRVSEPASETATTPTTSSSTSTAVQSVRPSPPPIDYYAAPPVPERSWKDYFIMATATVGVTYGLYQVFSRYLVPSILPPTQTAIDKDKEKIEEEFLKVDKILEQLSQDQETMKTNNEAKLKDIDTVIENVNDFLSKYNKDKLKFDDDLRLMKLEIDNLSNSIEKNMSLTKENINDELSEITQELTSLKNLIKARNGQSNGKERKIAPVSSIPSASEILKRAKAKTETPSPEVPKAKPVDTPSPVVSTPSQERVGSVTIDGVTAGGIPAWQMKDKEKEEQQEREKEQQPSKEAETVVEAPSPSSSSNGIPAWQAAAATAASAPPTAKTEEEIQEKIASIGVPSWQLNANKNSEPAKDSGIPAWQRSV